MDRNTITSVQRAADILQCLGNGMYRINDIYSTLELSKSAVHRFLKTLQISSLVIRDPLTRHYYLGPQILRLASKPPFSHQYLIVSAYEEMKRLRNLIGESVVLHIMIGMERVCLADFASPEDIIFNQVKGSSNPIYVGAAGKMLLSQLPSKDLRVILNNMNFESVAPNTVRDKETLLNSIEEIKKLGYAIAFSERIIGGAGFSVPIRGYSSPVALTILGPANRFSKKTMMKYVEVIKSSARSIERRLIDFESNN